jgi:hypothetical protein
VRALALPSGRSWRRLPSRCLVALVGVAMLGTQLGTPVPSIAAGGGASALLGAEATCANGGSPITTMAELQAVGADAISLAGSYCLANDLDASGVTFTPLGSSSSPFMGIFDGQAHAISNLTINLPSRDDVGLFGTLGTTAQVRNVGLVNVSMTGGYTVGALAGELRGRVWDSYSTGSVTGNSAGGLVGSTSGYDVRDLSYGIRGSYSTATVSGSSGAGGLLGTNYYEVVSNSYATGTVNGHGYATGGLVGWNSSGGSIDHSYSTGSVTTDGAGGWIGGLVGNNVNTVTTSYWDVTTSGQASSPSGTGLTDAQMRQQASFSGWGFGSTWGALSGVTYPYLAWQRPYLTGVSPVSGDTSVPGGENVTVTFDEAMDGASFTDSSFYLTASGSTTHLAATLSWNSTTRTATLNPSDDFTARGAYTVTVKGGAGGVKAETGATLASDAVWNFGACTPISTMAELQAIGTDSTSLSGIYCLANDLDASSFGNFTPIGSSQLSAFVGTFNGAGHTISHLTVNHPELDGVGLFGYVGRWGLVKNVGLEDVAVTGRNDVGGLAGATKDAFYVDLRDLGVVSNSYSTGMVTGSGYVGGLVGWNTGKTTSSYSSASVTGGADVGGLVGLNQGSAGGIITASYSTGSVGPGDAYGVGGLVGDNSGSVTNSYWDVDASGRTGSAGGTGLTDAQMRQQASFTGFDFGRTWGTANGVTYPYLGWQAPVVAAVSPAANATAVAVTSEVTVTFNVPVAAGSITDSTVYLTLLGSDTHVPAALSLSADGLIATLDPAADLAGAAYSVTVVGGGDGVRSAAGRPLSVPSSGPFAGQWQWSFSTAGAGEASHFVVSAPSGALVGTAFSFTVTALDGNGDVDTGYSGSVHFTSSDGAANLPSDSTLVEGSALFSATLNTAGNHTISATDAANSSIGGTSGAVTVIVAPISVSGSTSTGTVLGGTLLQGPPPGGVAAGDVLIAQVTFRHSGGASVTAPEGWYHTADHWLSTSNYGFGKYLAQAVFYRIVGSSEPPSYNWTFNTSVDAIVAITGFRGVDTAMPIDAWDVGACESSCTTLTAPNVTMTVANDQVVAMFAIALSAAWSSNDISTPAGMTELGDFVVANGSTDGISMSSDFIATAEAGATGDMIATSTHTGSGYGWVTNTIALRPAPPPEPPTVINVTSGHADGTFTAGTVIDISVQFGGVVTVTGSPTLGLETGATDRNATYLSGSGSDTLLFRYTVQPGDESSDLDYTGTTALALNGGTIEDAFGNNAVLTLPEPGSSGSLGANKSMVVDAAPPAPPATVYDGSTVGVDADWTTSANSLSANWTASTSSDVAGYWYAIGTSPGGQQTVVWTSIGDVTTFTKNSLPLVLGTRYYFSIKARDAAGNISATATASDGITYTASPQLEGLYGDAAHTSESYLSAFDQAVYAFASGLRGNSGYSYKFQVYGPSGGPVYESSCTQPTTSATWAGSYTPTAASGAGYYTWHFYEWANGVCSGTPTDAFKSFSVAQATAYTSAALSATTSSYSTGATAYVVVNGLSPYGGDDWTVSWLASGIDCANTAGTDRPDAAGYDAGDGTPGRLPHTATSYLQYPPSSGDAWNTLANYETQTACSPLAEANVGQWQLALYYDATHHVTLNAFTVIGNSAPATPTSLAQYRSNGSTVIATGGATNETTVVVKATVSDADAGNTVRLEVEAKPIGTDFDGTGTVTGSLVASGSTASATLSGLTASVIYHWRARSIDSQGATSDWASFGGNAESSADFSVDQTAPAAPATVYDGPNTGVDEDYVSWTSDGSSLVYANWPASASSDAASYSYAVGTTPGATNLVGWQSVGGATGVTRVVAPAIAVGTTYFVSVRVSDTAGNVSGVTTSDGITVISAPRVDKLFSDAALTSENYVFSAGQTVRALAVGLRGTSTYSYQFVIYGPSGSPVYSGSCSTASGSLGGAYTPSAAGSYTWTLQEWATNYCGGTYVGAYSKSFSVAQVTAYTSSALTTTTTSYGPGSTAYVVVNGLLPTAGEDWNVSWLASGIDCANTAGTDRPDSAGYAVGDGPPGRLPRTPTSYLQYPPSSGDEWNTLTNYETQTACSPWAEANVGQWQLALYWDATHHVTLDAFSVVSNHTPTDIGLSDSSVAENQSSGTTVGTLSTTDPDAGNSFVYTLVTGTGSTDNASFSISGNELRTAAVFDYEAKSSYSIRVRTTDQGGLYFEKVFTVTITNVNEAPTLTTVSLLPGATEDTSLSITYDTLATAANEADEDGDSLSFRVEAVSSGTLTKGGVAVVAGSTLLGSGETLVWTPAANASGTLNAFTVKAWDGALASATAVQVQVSVTAVNDAPTISDIGDQTIVENGNTGAIGFTVGDVDTDLNSLGLQGGSSNTALVPLSNIVFGGSGASRAVTVSPVAGASGAATITVTVSDGALTASDTFVLTVTPINRTPTDIGLSNSSVAENQSSGTLVGNLSTTDPDAGNTFVYTLVSGTGDTDNASFSISSNVLQTAASFDYETLNSFSIRIRSTDQGGLYFEKAFTITVTNLNEAPTDISLSIDSVAENQPVDTTVGTFGTTDPDVGDSFTYTLVEGVGDTDNASFSIGEGGLLQTAAVFDYESQTSYSILVRTTDAGDEYCEEQFIVYVTNVNEQPTDITLSNSSVAENEPVDTLVGTFSTTDPDGATAGFGPLAAVGFTYTLVSGTGSTDNGSFAIADYSNELRTTTAFNYETKASYSIRVRTTDNGGLYFEKVFSITVTNVNEAPVNTVPDAQTAASGSALVLSTANGNAPSVDDVDAGSAAIQVGLSVDHGTLTLASTTGLTFTAGDGMADAAMTFSGTLTDVNGALDGLTYMPAAGYSGSDTLSITTNDLGHTGSGGAQSDTDTVAITVSEAVNHAPTLTAVDTLTGATEDTSFTITYSMLVAAADEADVDGDTVSFRVEAVSSGTLTKDGVAVVAGGTLLGSDDTLVWTPAANANGTLDAFTIKAWDGALASATAVQVRVAVTAVNDAPTISDVGNQTIVQDSTTGEIALTVGDIDTDLTSLGLQGGSSNTALVPLTGIVFGGSGANRTVTLTPTAGSSGTSTITLTVSDGALTASDSFLLTVTPTGSAPTIVRQPVDHAVRVGENVSFTAGASGSASTQWQVSTDGGATWLDIAGADSPKLTLSNVSAAMNGQHYRALFSNLFGDTPTNAVTLTVGEPVRIDTQPGDQTVTAGATATFSAAATGSPAPAIAWQVSTTRGRTWSNLDGETSATLSLTTVTTTMSGYRYRAVFTNPFGSVNSNAAVLTVIWKATAIGTTVLLESSANPSADDSVTLTATVVPVSGGGLPTGSVTFSEGRTTLGSAALNDSGVATLNAQLGDGVHGITAQYGGDANYNPSTSGMLTQVVSGLPTTTTDVGITLTGAQTGSVSGVPTVTWTIVVRNLGQETATGVEVSDTLVPGTKVLVVRAPQPQLPGEQPTNFPTTIKGRTVTVEIGDLPAGASATIQIEIDASVVKSMATVSNTATVTTTSLDANSSNNTATASIVLVPSGAFAFLAIADLAALARPIRRKVAGLRATS